MALLMFTADQKISAHGHLGGNKTLTLPSCLIPPLAKPFVNGGTVALKTSTPML